MKNILIIGQKSFIAKNFIEDYSQKFNLLYFKKRFTNRYKKKFINILDKFIKKKKIKIVLNFAANNDNSYSSNYKDILESNFYLPASLLELSKRNGVTLFLFLSKDMENNNKIKNFYSISKEMLHVLIKNKKHNFKLRVLNIDSIFGPHDTNYKRIFPSLFNNLYNKKKVKVKLKQIKRFSYVKDLNKMIFKLTFNKKKFIYKDVKSDQLNIKDIYSHFKIKKKNITKKFVNYDALLLTAKWYKNYYGKK